MKRLAVLTEMVILGMNAAVKRCPDGACHGCRDICIERGCTGLLDEDITPMTSASVGGIVLRGGTIADTCSFH